MGVTKPFPSRSVLERTTVEGESPVSGRRRSPVRHLSRAEHVEVGSNQRGPSRKAKYSLATDSERVARAKDEKNPYQGRIVNLKPPAYKRSEPHVRKDGVMVCLLHNDPATYRRQPG